MQKEKRELNIAEEGPAERFITSMQFFLKRLEEDFELEIKDISGNRIIINSKKAAYGNFQHLFPSARYIVRIFYNVLNESKEGQFVEMISSIVGPSGKVSQSITEYGGKSIVVSFDIY